MGYAGAGGFAHGRLLNPWYEYFHDYDGHNSETTSLRCDGDESGLHECSSLVRHDTCGWLAAAVVCTSTYMSRGELPGALD